MEVRFSGRGFRTTFLREDSDGPLCKKHDKLYEMDLYCMLKQANSFYSEGASTIYFQTIRFSVTDYLIAVRFLQNPLK